MSEIEGQSGTLTETLTEEECKTLNKALQRVEAQVFQSVLKRLGVWISVVMSVLLIGGIINLSSWSSNVENNAATKLSNDPEVRDKVVAKVQENLKEVEKKMKGLNEAAAEIERNNARAMSSFVTDLEQIRKMMEKLEEELSNRRNNKNGAKK